MNKTIEYYNENADKFITDTQTVSMSDIQKEFLSKIPVGGKILDLGCGSGRDSKAFIDAGYDVVSVDGSWQMCDATSKLTGRPAICSTFQEYKAVDIFDGIWACASLLHLSIEDIERVVKGLANNLSEKGCFYMSFKYGNYCGDRNGRFFTDFDEERIHSLIEKIPLLNLDKNMLTSDVRPGRENEKWLNCFCSRVKTPND